MPLMQKNLGGGSVETPFGLVRQIKSLPFGSYRFDACSVVSGSGPEIYVLTWKLVWPPENNQPTSGIILRTTNFEMFCRVVNEIERPKKSMGREENGSNTNSMPSMRFKS